MSFFNVSDWLVIGVYLLGIIGLGVWFGKDQKNTRDYFLGSKTTPWWGIGMSIVAAETSALTIISVPAMAFGGNISFIQIIVGYVIARIILAVVMVPHYLKGEIYSPYQLLENAFGPSARKVAGGIEQFDGNVVFRLCYVVEARVIHERSDVTAHAAQKRRTADTVRRIHRACFHVVRKTDRMTYFVCNHVFDKATHQRVRHWQTLRAHIEWTHLREIPVAQQLHHIVIHVDFSFEDLTCARIHNLSARGVLYRRRPPVDD